MRSPSARIAAALGAVAAAAALSSCSGPPPEDHGADSSAAQRTDTAAQPAGYNTEDIAFAQNMIPHHEQAIEMSALVPGRSTNPQIATLASQISAAQGPEVRTLDVFLVQWQENPESVVGHSGHGPTSMDGMVDQATMAKLASLAGAEFDRLWLKSMIGHHQGAIEMAKAEIAHGANTDAIGMANNIVATQQVEMGQMRTMSGG